MIMREKNKSKEIIIELDKEFNNKEFKDILMSMFQDLTVYDEEYKNIDDKIDKLFKQRNLKDNAYVQPITF